MSVKARFYIIHATKECWMYTSSNRGDRATDETANNLTDVTLHTFTQFEHVYAIDVLFIGVQFVCLHEYHVPCCSHLVETVRVVHQTLKLGHWQTFRQRIGLLQRA